ncbi:hypothetical protein YC2023_098395 [Brassica napus]
MEGDLEIFTDSRNGDRERYERDGCGCILCRDRMFYRRQPQDAAFGRVVRRSFLRQRNEQELTQNVDAAAAAGTCGNKTNSPYVSCFISAVSPYPCSTTSLLYPSRVTRPMVGKRCLFCSRVVQIYTL